MLEQIRIEWHAFVCSMCVHISQFTVRLNNWAYDTGDAHADKALKLLDARLKRLGHR